MNRLEHVTNIIPGNISGAFTGFYVYIKQSMSMIITLAGTFGGL